MVTYLALLDVTLQVEFGAGGVQYLVGYVCGNL